MAFLQHFPKTTYHLKDGRWINLENLFVSVAVANLVRSQTLLFMPVNVQIHDTPQSIAVELYDDPSLDWTLLLVNHQLCPLRDWVRSPEQLQESLRDYNHTLFFWDSRLKTYVDDVDERRFLQYKGVLPEYIQRVRRRDFEYEENQKRNKIWAVNPQHIYTFVDAVLDALKLDINL